MDVSLPIRSVSPLLEGDVLAVLAATTQPMTGRRVASLTAGRSQKAVQRALSRLVGHGVVRASVHGSGTLYWANRDHLAWPAIQCLTDLSALLDLRIKEEVTAWAIAPTSVAMFGSGARRDGDENSDIDILIVEPDVIPDLDLWERQFDNLAGSIERWTGNRVQTLSTNRDGIRTYVRRGERIVQGWISDARTLAGEDISTLVQGIVRSDHAVRVAAISRPEVAR